MSPKRQRMWIVIAGIAFMGVGTALILHNFSEHLIYFYTPTQLYEAVGPMWDSNKTARLGGLVKRGSITSTGEQSITFVVTDLTNEVVVTYTGTLPSLFREGQGVIAEGKYGYSSNIFRADKILAKHDEYYLPKEVVDELKRSGHWEQYQETGEMPK